MLENVKKEHSVSLLLCNELLTYREVSFSQLVLNITRIWLSDPDLGCLGLSKYPKEGPEVVEYMEVSYSAV